MWENPWSLVVRKHRVLTVTKEVPRPSSCLPSTSWPLPAASQGFALTYLQEKETQDRVRECPCISCHLHGRSFLFLGWFWHSGSSCWECHAESLRLLYTPLWELWLSQFFRACRLEHLLVCKAARQVQASFRSPNSTEGTEGVSGHHHPLLPGGHSSPFFPVSSAPRPQHFYLQNSVAVYPAPKGTSHSIFQHVYLGRLVTWKRASITFLPRDGTFSTQICPLETKPTKAWSELEKLATCKRIIYKDQLYTFLWSE